MHFLPVRHRQNRVEKHGGIPVDGAHDHPLQDAHLGRGDGPARTVDAAVLQHRVPQIVRQRPHGGELAPFHRRADLVEPGLPQQ
jgi:hypothetical protein